MEENQVIKEYFKLADRFLRTAKLVFNDGDLRSACDRAYYAVFQAATAALTSKGITAKTHRGLKNQFSKEFIKTKQIEEKFIQALEEAFDARQSSNYELYAQFGEEGVKGIIEKAESFVSKIREMLRV